MDSPHDGRTPPPPARTRPVPRHPPVGSQRPLPPLDPAPAPRTFHRRPGRRIGQWRPRPAAGHPGRGGARHRHRPHHRRTRAGTHGSRGSGDVLRRGRAGGRTVRALRRHHLRRDRPPPAVGRSTHALPPTPRSRGNADRRRPLPPAVPERPPDRRRRPSVEHRHGLDQEHGPPSPAPSSHDRPDPTSDDGLSGHRSRRPARAARRAARRRPFWRYTLVWKRGPSPAE